MPGNSPAGLLLFLFLVPGLSRAQSAGRSPSDIEQFSLIRAAYEAALNNDDIDRIIPHMDPNFIGAMVTGDEVRGPEGLREFWAKVKAVIRQGRPGGSYRVRLLPEDFRVDGDRATARGRTQEEVTTGRGIEIKYQSMWNVELGRVGGRWVLKGLKSEANAADKLTLAARYIAARMWKPLDFFEPPKAGPDFDGDGGVRRRVMEGAPDPGAKPGDAKADSAGGAARGAAETARYAR